MALRRADLPLHEHPRERLIALGPAALNERELLTLLISGGVRGASASDLAGSVLSWGGGLRAIASARPEELAGLTGIGLTKASALVAAFELGRRWACPTKGSSSAVLRTSRRSRNTDLADFRTPDMVSWIMQGRGGS